MCHSMPKTVQSLEDRERIGYCTYNQEHFTLVENRKLIDFKQLKKHLLLKMNAFGYNLIKIISVNLWFSGKLKIND